MSGHISCRCEEVSAIDRDKLYIGSYREDDIPSIIKLFSISFGKDASEEWFLWKYRGSPWSSKGYVAVHENRLVAFYGGIKLRFVFNSGEFWAYQFCDVMTHPQYRGKFIGKSPLIVKLGEMFYTENPMDFAFGFPSIRHAKLQSLRLGGEGYRLVRLYKKENLKGYPILWKLKVSEGWEFFRKEELNRFRNPSLPPFSKGEEGGLSGKNMLQLIKNEEYLRWRYIENPSKKYRLLVFKRLNIIKGYIIFTTEDSWFNILEIFIKDLKGLGDILASLEAYILSNMDNIKGIKAWFHPEETFKKHLDYYGYNCEDSIPIAFKPVNKDSGVTSDIFYGRYFYRMGDYDAL
jgi:GNAT superfamily N-acetyltransferase